MPKRETKKILNRIIQIIKFRIMHLNDSPHRIALGIALGLFIAWTPVLGFHILLALILSFILKANKFAALTSIWVCNPFTMAAIYYPNYLFGKIIVNFFRISVNSSPSEPLLKKLDLSAITFNFFSGQFWKNLIQLLWSKSLELWIGSLIIGFVAAFCGYYLTNKLIVIYRKKHPHRRFLVNP